MARARAFRRPRSGQFGRTAHAGERSAIARALEVVGERWTLLIVRDALLGLRRFDEFQRNLGIARKVLAERLRWLVDEGILERVRYQDGRSGTSTT